MLWCLYLKIKYVLDSANPVMLADSTDKILYECTEPNTMAEKHAANIGKRLCQIFLVKASNNSIGANWKNNVSNGGAKNKAIKTW